MNRLEALSKRLRVDFESKESSETFLKMFIAASGAGIALFVLWNNVDVSPWYLKHAVRLLEASPLEAISVAQLFRGLKQSQQEELQEVMEFEAM